MKKALVLGATGAMGVYVVPELVKKGYFVDAVSLDDVENESENVRYLRENGKDINFIKEIVKNNYDVIIDFMLFNLVDDNFEEIMKIYLQNTKHYFYLSTYRIYANEEIPIKETSPRLLDVTKEEALLTFNDYSMYKAKGEDIIRNSGYKNWTIIRPAITYSKNRFQLTVLEANILLERTFKGKTVILPEAAMDCQATMSWAGDVAKMFANLANNEIAFGEVYTFATSEHHTWREIAEYYKEIAGLEYITVSTDDFVSLYPENLHCSVRNQLLFDRCYERVIDNSKVLRDAKLEDYTFMPLKDGLLKEYKALPENSFEKVTVISENMDKYLENH